MQSSTPVIPGLEPYELKIGGPEANQPQYNTLHALRAPDGRVMSRWELTRDERTAIADGADIFLSISTNGQPYPPTLVQVMRADESFAEFVKNDMQLDDELALRVIHDDIVRSQAAFQAKITEINSKLQRAAELRKSLGGE
jgi:hypothetical protein